MILNVALCTDENFVVPALVCLVSLLENNKGDECRIYVLTEGLSDDAVSKFTKLANAYKQEIKVIRPDISKLNNLVTRGRYRKSMYFRFLLPDILKDESSVLYIDCDIMVRKPLNQLFQADLKGIACGVVEDQQCDDVQILNRLKITSRYFNSGVMLMNLDYWRKYDVAEKLMQFIDKNPDKCVYPDQDALNVILSDKVTYLDYGYNYQEMWYTMRDYARFHFSKWKELDEAGKDPAIVHFCVDEKPWYEECRNPFKAEYLKYATMCHFIGFKKKKRYGWLYYRLNAEIMRLKRWQGKTINK